MQLEWSKYYKYTFRQMKKDQMLYPDSKLKLYQDIFIKIFADRNFLG